MPTYHLSPKPEIAAGLQLGYPVGDRLAAVALAAGYVIGEGGIQVYRDGSVVIDCDRDPSADWATFDPLTMLTPDEVALNEVKQAVEDLLTTLAANETQLVAGIATLKGPTPPATIAALRTYVTAMAEMTLDHNRGLDRLIRYLVRAGVIGP